MIRAALAGMVALLLVAAPVVARPAPGVPGGYRADALLCLADADAGVRVWWSDTPGDGDAPAGADGVCATVPPWIAEVGLAARHALDAAVRLGFPLPPTDSRLGGDARYDVYVLDVGAQEPGLLGRTEPDGGGRSSSLRVDESYVDELPEGYATTPLDEMRVTVAHELFHAVQYGLGADSLPPWIMEGTAVWFEAQAQPTIPDNHGYLRRHLTGARGRLPLWAGGGCGQPCWAPGLPHDENHVYATWLFFWSAADERGDRDLVHRLLRSLAGGPTPADHGLAALREVSGGTLAVRLREYGLGLLLRRRIGPWPLSSVLLAGPGREPGATSATTASGWLWPLQPLLVPVAATRTVELRTAPLPAAAIRRGVGLVTAEGAVLRLPRVDGGALVFDLPAGSRGGTVVLTSAQPAWPLTYRLTAQ